MLSNICEQYRLFSGALLRTLSVDGILGDIAECTRGFVQRCLVGAARRRPRGEEARESFGCDRWRSFRSSTMYCSFRNLVLGVCHAVGPANCRYRESSTVVGCYDVEAGKVIYIGRLLM